MPQYSNYHISFVTSTLNSGGSERVISLLANALQERGHSVEIININRHEVFYPINAEVKLTFVEEGCGSTFIGKKLLWLRHHIQRTHPDVVLPFMTDVYSVTLLSLVGTMIPTISCERYDPHESNLLFKILRFVFLPLTTHFVVQTNYIKSYFPKRIQRKTSIIYNPVTDKVFEESPNGIKKQNHIVSLGRLAPQKNFTMMIHAFSQVAKDFPEWRLNIYGEGPLRDELQKEIDGLGLKNQISLCGRTSNAIDVLRQSKVFCMSSNGEGMSNALIEAICIGMPVLTTAVSGAEELVEDGVTGFVTPLRDEERFAKALKTLLESDKLREDMGIRNLESRDRFKLSNVVTLWEETIRQVIENTMSKK